MGDMGHHHGRAYDGQQPEMGRGSIVVEGRGGRVCGGGGAAAPAQSNGH